MPTIAIQGKEYSYDESEIVDFAEGLIGLPEMRHAVVIPMPEFEPFCWLASIESEKNRFVVINPHEIFADYSPSVLEELDKSRMKTLVIVCVSSDWQKTTVNLRAPVFINAETRRGAQIILTESSYRFAESLPQN